MFDSLDAQIKQDEHKGTTGKQRMMHWLVIGLISAVAIGGIALGVTLMQ